MTLISSAAWFVFGLILMLLTTAVAPIAALLFAPACILFMWGGNLAAFGRDVVGALVGVREAVKDRKGA